MCPFLRCDSVRHVTLATVIARGDNGHWQPNYSRVLGNFSSPISSIPPPTADHR